MTSTPDRAETALDCELCIVGAGYAALNGLNAAAKYLKRGDRVVIVDRNETWGGQWLHQYDFVRLHQPYQMFTAGDQPWTLKRDPSHLATRREVLDHLATVPLISAGQLELKPLFRHRYTAHRVHAGRVEVEAVPLGGADLVRIRPRRLLKAGGFDLEMLPAFPLSSSRVRSVGVADPRLASAEFLESDAPIYLIGSGKTAMDSARHFIRLGREVHVILGSGMWFFSRDVHYPTGSARHYRGAFVAETFLQIAQRFDGQNETQVINEMAARQRMINVFGEAANCRLGLLSRAERAEIGAGVREVHRGYLLDVEGTQLILRQRGQVRKMPVREGAWFINCTAHMKQRPHQPLLQDGGLTCAPQGCLGLSGNSAYYLTHLWYRDDLAPIAARLFRARVDVEPKLRLITQIALGIMANMGRVAQRIPVSITSRYRGEFTHWYPLHRKLLAFARITSQRQAMIDKAERILTLRFSDAIEDEPSSAPRRATASTALE